MKMFRRPLALLLVLCLLLPAAQGLAAAAVEAASPPAPGLEPLPLPPLDPVILMAAQGDYLAVLTRQEAEDRHLLHLFRLPAMEPLARADLEAGLRLDYLANDHLGFLTDGRIYVLSLFTGTLVLFDKGLSAREDIPFGKGSRFQTALLQEDGAVLWAADTLGNLTRFDVHTGSRQPLFPQLPPGWHFVHFIRGEQGRIQAQYDNDEGLSLLVTVDGAGQASLTPVLPGHNWFSGRRALLSGNSLALLYVPGQEEVLKIQGWDSFESPLTLMEDSLLTIHYKEAQAVLKRYSLKDRGLKNRLQIPQEAGDMMFSQVQDIGAGRVLLLYQSLDMDQQHLYLWDSAARADLLEASIIPTTVHAFARENDALARELEIRSGIRVHMRHAGAGFINWVYTGQPALEELRIREALHAISAFFEQLPPGFVRESLVPPFTELALYLAGPILQTSQEGIMSAGGFSSQEGASRYIVLDVRDIGFEKILAHEFMHVLEDRLEEAAGKSHWPVLFLWHRLGPQEAEDYGFHFRYTDPEGYTLSDTAYTAQGPDARERPDQVWFIDAYSRTMPLEDRARIFEYLLAPGSLEDPFQHPRIRRKAQILCALIREAYPSVAALKKAPWEEGLPETDHQQLLEAVYEELTSLE